MCHNVVEMYHGSVLHRGMPLVASHLVVWMRCVKQCELHTRTVPIRPADYADGRVFVNVGDAAWCFYEP